MLTAAAKQQVKVCCQLGLRNQFYEEIVVPKLEIKDNWSSLILKQGTFNSLGLKRFYMKDRKIRVKDKDYTPYTGFLMPVMEKDVFVIQCILGDYIRLRIVGNDEDIEYLSGLVRKDNPLTECVTFEDFKEANRRDLEFHKKVMTNIANYNQSPERFDEYGQVITSLDHFDNFEYKMVETEENIYKVYNIEKEKRRLEAKVIYLEEKKLDYDYCIDEKYIQDAIDVIINLTPYEIEKYFNQKGNYVFENQKEICFETGLTRGEMWKAWKYMNWIRIEDEIEEINQVIDRLENLDPDAKIEDDKLLADIFR